VISTIDGLVFINSKDLLWAADDFLTDSSCAVFFQQKHPGDEELVGILIPNSNFFFIDEILYCNTFNRVAIEGKCCGESGKCGVCHPFRSQFVSCSLIHPEHWRRLEVS